MSGASYVFDHVGRLTAVDNSCFINTDKSIMRGYVEVEPNATIPPVLSVRLPNDKIVPVLLRVV